MFKPARWWSDKNRVKVVFKLQFHASQVTQVGGNELMISVVPSDTGKPTVKSGKAMIRDGRCLWENAVYETVKFNQDPRSGKVLERIYYFILGTGASKSGVVGEASIDFSNYVEATKPSLVSLPLKNSKCEGVLHVSIQRVLQSMEQREIGEIENANLYPELENHDADGTIRISSVENVPSSKTVSEAEFKSKRRGSSGSDVALSSSVSSSGVEAPWELKNDNVHEGLKSEDQRSWEFLGNSAVEDSTDDSSSTVRETFLNEAPDLVIERLKTDVAALSRQAEMCDLELLALRKQISKENKRGQDLWGEVICLKEERDALKMECEQLKGTRSKCDLLFDDGMDSREIVEELRQELNHAKELNSNLRIQLQKTLESNSELILAVQDLEEMLEQKNREKGMDDDDEEQKALEDLVKEHNDANGSLLLERRIKELRSEIENYKRDKDDLEMQMEQLALDYEILKQANHDMSYKLQQSQIEEQLELQYECSSPDAFVNELETRVENLENELKIRSKEYEDSLASISELKAHAKSLEEELEKQAQGFEADLESLTVSKIEQEQRAIRAEETLKKMRWRNANTAERLQEEFRKLSVQMASTFEMNEKLATNALAEANELRLQKSCLEDMLRKTHEEHESVKSHYEARLQKVNSEIEHQKKHAEDTHKVLRDEICVLKDDIEAHIAKNRILLEDMRSKEGVKRELDKMRIPIKEMELLVEQGNDEKNELESRVLVMKAEAEELHKELTKMKSVVKEKELVVGNLQSEVDSLQANCTELMHSLEEDEVEKEKLRKQVLQLKSDLKKKKDDCMEKKTKDGRGRATTIDAVRATSKTSKPHPRESKEVANLKERIKLLESQIKLKEAALETSSNAFLVKEKDLINKIVALDGKLESSAHSCENEVEKAADAAVDDQDPNRTMIDEAGNDNEDLTKSNDLSEVYIKEFKNEMASLDERNKSMERDLKEMQERYLDISLKFAEVEGERQQLVMKLRYLTNTSKSS
ncbi:hypothetical protein ACS0TY_022186 [Phlomoides rotata]